MLEYARSSLRIRSFIIFLLLSVPLSAAHIAPAAAQMSERPDGGGRPRGGSGVGVGVGIDVGIGIANELMRQRARDEEIERSIRAQRKKKETAKPAPAAGPKKPPVELGIYTPPVFPEIPRPTNCDDCMKLWNSLVEYERIIAEDTRKLAERRQQVNNINAELLDLRGRLQSASTSYDRTYYRSLISIAEDSIRARTEQNAGLQRLVDEEWRILRDRIAQYQACFDKYCPKTPVAEVLPPPPPLVSIPPTPPPVVVSTPPKPPPVASKPDLPPNDNRKICGPDITDQVLKVLADIKKKFDENPERQTQACRALFDPKTGPSAWDIVELSPGVAPVKDSSYDPSTDEFVEPPDPAAPNAPRDRKKPWFTSVSNYCAIPRPVCGATVTFLGTCQHAQVVNYTQWGMVTSLCGGLYPLIGAALHKVWNAKEYGLTAPSGPQQNMVSVGSEYKEELDKAPAGAASGSFVPDITEIKRRLQERDREIKHAEQDCELKCELTAEQRRKLTERDFGFRWTGMWSDSPPPQTTVREIPDTVRQKAPSLDEVRQQVGR